VLKLHAADITFSIVQVYGRNQTAIGVVDNGSKKRMLKTGRLEKTPSVFIRKASEKFPFENNCYVDFRFFLTRKILDRKTTGFSIDQTIKSELF
jgi:hypothetical protein